MNRPGKHSAAGFEEIFETHKEHVLNLCGRFVGKDDAEDVCQEVFFKVYKSLGTFKNRSKLSTWIYRIAVNQCLNHLRSRKLRRGPSGTSAQDPSCPPPVRETAAPSGERPDLTFEMNEMRAVVLNAVRALPGNQKTVLILQKYEGYSPAEIAEITGWTLSSVQSLLHRAKRNLYKKLEPYRGEWR